MALCGRKEKNEEEGKDQGASKGLGTGSGTKTKATRLGRESMPDRLAKRFEENRGNKKGRRG